MSYQDDPNINHRPIEPRPIESRPGDNTAMWIAGVAAVAVVVGLVAFAANRDSKTAVNTPPATTSSPASTTGSGTPSVRPSEMPNNPNGTTPQRDMNQPAPQSR